MNGNTKVTQGLLLSVLHQPDPILALLDPSNRNKVTTEAAPVKPLIEWLKETAKICLPVFHIVQ